MISKVKPAVKEAGEWFETWFDSPYYHILYKERDQDEAEAFLDALIAYLKPADHSRILDVACGKGRHSIYLNEKGFDVTGFDLSEESILHNKDFENDTLHFYLHDMREVFRANYFDIVMNLFSSFGYFRTERDNIRCLIAHSSALKKEGIFVFDYFNSEKILAGGNSNFTKTVDGIDFHITKTIVGKEIIKEIEFTDNGQAYHFEERVKLYSRADLEKYFLSAGLNITNAFGNYALEEFDSKNSDRLILVARKKPVVHAAN
ncbi:MAG: class I SAM-dependent methyltransferase [Bacteroidetes bacterium]|nr:class I SAM-dependent methyltransferase [Bacteroidota bacterium]